MSKFSMIRVQCEINILHTSRFSLSCHFYPSVTESQVSKLLDHNMKEYGHEKFSLHLVNLGDKTGE